MRLVAFLAAVGCLLWGCSTPLGATTYPHARMSGIEGTWELAAAPSGKATDGDASGRCIVQIRRGRAAAVGSGFGDIDAVSGPGLAGSTEDRYLVTVILEELEKVADTGGNKDGGGRELFPIELEGEFISTRHWTLFTYQRSVSQMDWTGLSTPLQRTLRVELDADQLRVYSPSRAIYYVPIAFAGDFRFMPERATDSGPALAANVDDIFATLDKAGAEEWDQAMVLTRVKP